MAAIAARLSPLESERDKLKPAVATADAERKQLALENESLRDRVRSAEADVADLKNTVERSTAETRDAQTQLAAATRDRELARRESQALRGRIDAEPGLHKELLGLKGQLGRVAIVFDTSGSMGQSGRWEQARSVVATWLEHLAIGECALVLFSSDVQAFPEDGSFVDVRGPQGAINRRRLLERIAAVKPQGGTNTLNALETAYRFPRVDTIILFTDGEPNDPSRKIATQFDPDIAERIYVLCQEHKGIPVNTVGLGDYFKPQLSGFLMRVAQETGGSFLGR